MTNGPGRDLGVAVVVVAVAAAAAAAAWLDKHLFNMTIKTSQTAYAHAHTDTHTQTHAIWHTRIVISNKLQTRLQPNDTENHSCPLCVCVCV